MRWNFWLAVLAVCGSALVISESQAMACRHRRCGWGGGGCNTGCYSGCQTGGCGGCAAGTMTGQPGNAPMPPNANEQAPPAAPPTAPQAPKPSTSSVNPPSPAATSVVPANTASNYNGRMVRRGWYRW